MGVFGRKLGDTVGYRTARGGKQGRHHAAHHPLDFDPQKSPRSPPPKTPTNLGWTQRYSYIAKLLRDYAALARRGYRNHVAIAVNVLSLQGKDNKEDSPTLPAALLSRYEVSTTYKHKWI